MQNRAKFHFDNHYDQMQVGPYVVIQMGDLNCEAGYLVPEHIQTVHEITYVISGEGFVCANGKQYSVRRGSLVLNPMGDEHKIYSSMDVPLRYMYIGFSIRDDVQDEAVRALGRFFSKPDNYIVEDASATRELFVRLLTEAMERDRFSELLTECCMHQLLCHVYRLFHSEKKLLYKVAEGGKMDYNLFVYDITRYIDTHIDHILKLSSLSREFGYSYTYIASVFSKQMGETLYEYYHRRRFERACEYLNQGFSVTDTSRFLGYLSIHAFSRAFKRHFGISPSEYPDTHKE